MVVAHTISPRRAQTQARLMAAAVELFAEKGVLAASVEEICERAGFTRGAFYSNFEDKDELCLALLRGQCETYLRAAREALDSLEGCGDLDSLVGRAIDAFLAAQPDDRETVLMLAEMRLYAIRRPEMLEAYNRLDDEVTDLFVGTLTTALRGNRLRWRVPEADAIRLLHAVHEAASLSDLLGRPESGVRNQLLALVQTLIEPT